MQIIGSMRIYSSNDYKDTIYVSHDECGIICWIGIQGLLIKQKKSYLITGIDMINGWSL